MPKINIPSLPDKPSLNSRNEARELFDDTENFIFSHQQFASGLIEELEL